MLFLSLSLLFSTPSVFKSVSVGFYDAKPSCWINNDGEPEGIFIDVLEQMAELNDWQYTYDFKPWSELIGALRTGSVDIVPCIVNTEERQEYALFTDEPVMLDWGTVIVRRGYGLSDVFDLDTKRTGVVENDFWAFGEGAFETLRTSFNINSQYYYFSDYDTMLLALSQGHLDVAIASNSVSISYGEIYQVEATPIMFKPIELGYAVSRKTPNAELLRDSINESLKIIKKSNPGFIQSLLSENAVPVKKEIIVPVWIYYYFIAAFVLVSLLMIISIILAIHFRKGRKIILAYKDDLQVAMNASKLALWKWQAKDNSLTFSPEIRSLLSSPVPELTQSLSSWLSLTDNSDQLAKQLKKNCFQKDRNFDFEFYYRDRKNGKGLWLRLKGKAVTVDSQGSYLDIAGSLQDINREHDDRVQLIKSGHEIDTLFKEVHHRVKNNLQIVLSIVDLQLNSSETVSELSFHKAMNRIRSMAQIEQTLYDTGSLSEEGLISFLYTLKCKVKYEFLVTLNVLVNLKGQFIPAGVSTSLSLIIHELIYFYCPYLQNRTSNQCIDITFEKNDQNNSFNLDLIYPYNTIFPGLAVYKDSLSDLLVTNLTDQIGGLIEFKNDDEFYRISIAF